MTGSAARSGEITVHVFGSTDVGRTREHNEDAFIVADLTTMNATLQPEVRTHAPGARGTLFMVADGMGGAAAGEIASAMATEVVLSELDLRWRQASDSSPETFARALKDATEAANTRINRYAAEHPENRGMGTTATIAGILGDMLFLSQVGDSRGYLVRGGVARQITKDQSLMQKLIEAGELTAEEAEVSERRNIILQALGPEPMVKVDLTSQQVRQGDTLVLCSDGMSGQMRTADISRIVNEDPDLVATCRKLIDLANDNGGPDNITVIAARFEGPGLMAPNTGEDPVYHVYSGESEARATVRVRTDSIPGIDEDRPKVSPEAVTNEVSAIPVPPSESAKPAAAAEQNKIPIGVLRIIFGSLAALLALYLIFTAIRRS
ncbi:MAG: protein phosphatase 2C domain-containing protein [Gemmatimonadetes bacterium]|nr:protein phosphatase 2C domain-containing protein [Gemmatimonadota bacterium]